MNNKTDALMKTLDGVDRVAVIHAAFGETPRTVAFVDCKGTMSDNAKLEEAFVKTNSINDAWWKNEGVTPMFGEKSCRSTSVGDMVLIGTTKYECKPLGWEKI